MSSLKSRDETRQGEVINARCLFVFTRMAAAWSPSITTRYLNWSTFENDTRVDRPATDITPRGSSIHEYKGPDAARSARSRAKYPEQQ